MMTHAETSSSAPLRYKFYMILTRSRQGLL